MRIGFASDIHRLVDDRLLILGGVTIPFDKGELAHSDGDVIYHAVTEAIFGALALGDLGSHFPDNDDTYKDKDSSYFLKYAYVKMMELGYSINNIDISLSLERPKVHNYINKMRENMARILNCSINNVSIKAGTNEGQDAVGKGEAVKAEAIVLLKEKE